MNDSKKSKLSTDAYKGVRDFFPADMAVQNHIIDIWRTTVEKYGYQEYNASILEPAELFRAKSGDEIIKEQSYTFTDRGDREVTLRPEMTPTVARMVAGKRRELPFPLRWYSIPNLFRYEQPQRGRLREFWQLNIDIFGVTSIQAEVECIEIAHDIVRAYGLKESDFEVRINNRKIVNYVTRDVYGLNEESAQKLSKLIDRKSKVPADVFETAVSEILGDKARQFLTLLNSGNFEEFVGKLPQTKEEHEGIREIRELLSALEKLGITNARFDQTLMRGLDYYTGVVFELFDKNPANRRAVLGGGRYDDLLALFGGDKVPAVGFGMGDVVAQDLIATYSTLPTNTSSADLALCVMPSYLDYAQDLGQLLRRKGVRVAIDFSGRKIGDQIKTADRNNIPSIICIGEDEVKTGQFKLKNLKSGEEKVVSEETIASEVK